MSSSPNPYDAPTSPSGPSGFYPPPSRSPAPMILAIGSLVTALLSFVTCLCCGVFNPVPPLSILLGVIALCLKPDQNAKIMAIVGIALSALLLVLVVVLTILGIAVQSSDFQRALQQP